MVGQIKFPASLRSEEPLYRTTTYDLQTAMATSNSDSDDVDDGADECSKRGIDWYDEGSLMDLSWMWPVDASDLDEEDHRNDDDSERSGTSLNRASRKSIDDLLPEPASTRINARARTSPSFEDSGKGDEEMEENEYLARMIASKALVACHLYTTCHPFVGEAVWWLTRQWWSCRCFQESSESESNDNRDKNSGVEFRMLRWLSHNGLNVIAIINEHHKLVSGFKKKEAPSKADDYSNYRFLELM